MRALHVSILLLLAGFSGCRWMFTSNRIHEEHRFASGDLLTCDSWIEQGFKSRMGRTMQCWIESPGSWFKEDLGETWLSAGESQPDGPNMLKVSRRLELYRSGEWGALLMDNALRYKRPDLHNPAIGWFTWRISDDRWTEVFLRAAVSAALDEAERAAASSEKGAQQNAKAPVPPETRTSLPAGSKKPPLLSEPYQIATVELPSLRVVAELPQTASAIEGRPTKLIFRPRKLGPELNLNVEETMAANPGLKLPGFPPDVVFEVKVAETVDGKTRIVRRDILEALPNYQMEAAEFHNAKGTPEGRLIYSLKPGFRSGEQFVYYSRGYNLPDPDPVETKLGEWNSGGGVGTTSMEKHSLTFYVRCIRRGQESPLEEVPVVKQP